MGRSDMFSRVSSRLRKGVSIKVGSACPGACSVPEQGPAFGPGCEGGWAHSHSLLPVLCVAVEVNPVHTRMRMP